MILNSAEQVKYQIPILQMKIENKGEDEAVIDIDGDIGWVSWDGEKYNHNTKEAIKRQLKEIAEMKVANIVVNISSLGGFVDDAFAIHDILAQHKANVVTNAISFVASAATTIHQSGDNRKMSDNGLYLIHKSIGLGFGNVNDIGVLLEDLNTIDDRIANINAKRSKKDKGFFLELMQENNGGGKWLKPEEALEAGLVDEIYEPSGAAAAVNPMFFNLLNIPIPEGFEKEIVKVKETEKTNEFEFKSELETVVNDLLDKMDQKINSKIDNALNELAKKSRNEQERILTKLKLLTL